MNHNLNPTSWEHVFFHQLLFSPPPPPPPLSLKRPDASRSRRTSSGRLLGSEAISGKRSSATWTADSDMVNRTKLRREKSNKCGSDGSETNKSGCHPLHVADGEAAIISNKCPVRISSSWTCRQGILPKAKQKAPGRASAAPLHALSRCHRHRTPRTCGQQPSANAEPCSMGLKLQQQDSDPPPFQGHERLKRQLVTPLQGVTSCPFYWSSLPIPMSVLSPNTGCADPSERADPALQDTICQCRRLRVATDHTSEVAGQSYTTSSQGPCKSAWLDGAPLPKFSSHTGLCFCILGGLPLF